MNEVYLTEKRHGLTINIYQDENPINPREDDNFGTMLCFHKRYTLGDEQSSIRHEDFNDWEEMEVYLKEKLNAVIVMPLFLYDHSGISIATYRHGQHSSWDCGQVGFIYATKEKIRKEFNVKNVTKKILEKIEKILLSEVSTYNSYLTGDVYGYEIVNEDGENVDNSIGICWGFIGRDDNNIEYALIEAREEVDRLTNNGKTDASGQILIKEVLK